MPGGSLIVLLLLFLFMFIDMNNMMESNATERESKGKLELISKAIGKGMKKCSVGSENI